MLPWIPWSVYSNNNKCFQFTLCFSSQRILRWFTNDGRGLPHTALSCSHKGCFTISTGTAWQWKVENVLYPEWICRDCLGKQNVNGRPETRPRAEQQNARNQIGLGLELLIGFGSSLSSWLQFLLELGGNSFLLDRLAGQNLSLPTLRWVLKEKSILLQPAHWGPSSGMREIRLLSFCGPFSLLSEWLYSSRGNCSLWPQ